MVEFNAIINVLMAKKRYHYFKSLTLSKVLTKMEQILYNKKINCQKRFCN